MSACSRGAGMSKGVFREPSGGGSQISAVGMDRVAAISVVIGGFRPVVARGLVAVLEDEPHVRVLESAPRSCDVHWAVARHLPRVVVVDESVEHVVFRLLKSGSGAPPGIVVVAQSPSRLYTALLHAAGAACVTPGAAPAEIRAVVEDAALGSGGVADAAEDWASLGMRLTPAELRVLECLKRGASYAEIGERLHIAPETARSHSRSICRKLNVARKRDLIGFALPGERGD